MLYEAIQQKCDPEIRQQLETDNQQSPEEQAVAPRRAEC
jgi:hypothetical protein